MFKKSNPKREVQYKVSNKIKIVIKKKIVTSRESFNWKLVNAKWENQSKSVGLSHEFRNINKIKKGVKKNL